MSETTEQWRKRNRYAGYFSFTIITIAVLLIILLFPPTANAQPIMNSTTIENLTTMRSYQATEYMNFTFTNHSFLHTNATDIILISNTTTTLNSAEYAFNSTFLGITNLEKIGENVFYHVIYSYNSTLFLLDVRLGIDLNANTISLHNYTNSTFSRIANIGINNFNTLSGYVNRTGSQITTTTSTTTTTETATSSNSSTDWYQIAMIIGIFAVIGVVIFFFFRLKTKKQDKNRRMGVSQ
jgi:hypothetical protein